MSNIIASTPLPYFWTMEHLQRWHTNLGLQFFSTGTKRFFNSRIQSTPPYRGRVFVTSERMSDRYPRRYSVRYIDTNGDIITVCGFQAFESRYDAHVYAEAYAAENFDRWCHNNGVMKQCTCLS